jgi:hypothetical protein
VHDRKNDSRRLSSNDSQQPGEHNEKPNSHLQIAFPSDIVMTPGRTPTAVSQRRQKGQPRAGLKASLLSFQ